MNKWNLTETRLKVVLQKLMDQDTVAGIAQDFGISRRTLVDKLKEMGIKPEKVRNRGRSSMRTMLFKSIYSIPEEDKRVKAGLQYLDKYPIQEDEDEVVTSNNVDTIKIQILNELKQ